MIEVPDGKSSKNQLKHVRGKKQQEIVEDFFGFAICPINNTNSQLS